MDYEAIEEYAPRIVDGFVVTLELVSLSLLIGILIAVPMALLRLSPNRFLRGFAYGYIYFFRGTPLLAQVFLLYYGAGQFREFFESIHLWWFLKSAFNCAVLTFALNTAAYQAEILRGAIQGIPAGQWEAAKALGMGRNLTFIKIILPQAMLVALRPLGNEVILMIKASAIASIVTVYDLMGAAKLAFSNTFAFEFYLIVAIIYLFLVEAVRRLWDFMEKRMTRHVRAR